MDRCRLGICAIDRRLLHRLDLFRQRRPGGERWSVVSTHLSGADAGDAACRRRGAAHGAGGQAVAHHLGVRFHRHALRPGGGVGALRLALRLRRRGALCRFAAEGDFVRLRCAHRCAGCTRAGVVGRSQPVGGGGADRVRCALWHTPSRRDRAARRLGGGDRFRVGGQTGSLSVARRVGHLHRLFRSGRDRRGGAGEIRHGRPTDRCRRWAELR